MCFSWLQLLDIEEKKKKSSVLTVWSLGILDILHPGQWAPKQPYLTISWATYWENQHIPVTLQFRSGKRDFARTTYSFMVLAWCLWVAPAQWRSHWPAWSWFKLQSWFLSDQIIWFWVWPGADLKLTSICRDLWEKRGQRPDGIQSSLLQASLVIFFHILRPGHLSLEFGEDSMSSFSWGS